MTKQEVIDRQKELNKHGANLDVNGYWGPLTEAANKKFMMRDPDYTPTPYVRNKGTYYPENSEINAIIDLTTGKTRFVDSPPPLPPKPYRKGASIKKKVGGVIAGLPRLLPKPYGIGASIKKVGGVIAGLPRLLPKPYGIGASIKKVGGVIAGLPRLLPNISKAKGKGTYYLEDNGLHIPIDLTTGKTRFVDSPPNIPKPAVQQHPLTSSVKLSSLPPTPYVRNKGTYYLEDNGLHIPIDLTTGKGWYAESLPPLPPKPYRKGASIKGVIAPLVLAGIAAAYAKKQPDVSSGILSGMGYYYDTKKAAAEAAKAQEDKERLLAIEYGYKETAAKTLARAALDKGIKAFAAKQDEYFNKQLDDYASKGRTYPDKVLLQKGISPERIAALKGIAAEARKQAVYNRTFKRIPSEKKEPLAVKQAWTRLNKVDERIKQQEKTLAMYLSELSPEGLVIYNKDRVTTGQLPLKVFTPGKYIPGKWGKPGEAYYLNKESAEYYIDKGGIPKGTEIYVNGDPIGKVE